MHARKYRSVGLVEDDDAHRRAASLSPTRGLQSRLLSGEGSPRHSARIPRVPLLDRRAFALGVSLQGLECGVSR